MIRHALARLIHALADRIEPAKAEPEIQYVYIYSLPPASTIQPWQSPYYYGTTS